MGNNELNNRILKNVRSKIVVSSLEREEKMKVAKRNKVISICAAIMLVVSGGLFTVNAATDGKVAEEIKKFITIDYDQSKYKVVTENQTEVINGDEFVTYKLQSLDGTEEIETLINKSEFDRQNLNADVIMNSEATDDEVNSTVEITVKDRN